MKAVKSRRVWIAVAVFAVLLSSGVALYYLWWHPNTWRGRFDRVQMGMTEDEVKAMLGPPTSDIISFASYCPVVNAEQWLLRNNKIDVTQYPDQWSATTMLAMRDGQKQDFKRKHMFFGRNLSNSSPPFLEWTHGEAIVLVDFDNQRRVCGKTWFGRRQSFNLFDFLKSRLPF